eukprot:NODE_2203_length_2267_cov_32.802804.p1 GENE.NODE_2203_length_2267_cov_32.802804~~NODE_2203_length_2267_cov_32.802804.p1  ORF type:complete len:622 (-),score=147.52 NODE_2203_length_2267_cov_32.802804:284-2149(-)
MASNYELLEQTIRMDALRDAGRRAAQLERRLDELSAAAAVPVEAERELAYLERLISAAPLEDRHNDLVAHVARLRHRLLKHAEVAHLEDDGATPCRGVATVGRPPLPPRPPRPPLLPVATDLPPTGLRSAGGSPSKKCSSLTSSASSRHTVSFGATSALASFLHPDEPPAFGEDEVRLLAAAGALLTELGRHTNVSVPEAESTIVIRSWISSIDDKEQILMLELHTAVENVCALQSFIDVEVENSRGKIDMVERESIATQECVAQSLQILQSAGQHKRSVLKWVLPSIFVAAAGGAAFVGGPIGIAAATSAITGGTVLAGKAGLSAWEARLIDQLKEQVAKELQPLGEDEVVKLNQAGMRAENRLIAALNDPGWKKRWSFKTIYQHLEVTERPSKVRLGGHAFSTNVVVNLPASRLFRLLQQQHISDFLSLGSRWTWSRPTDASGSTFARYLVFRNWFARRDFFAVNRISRIRDVQDAPEGSVTQEANRRYVSATMSLDPSEYNDNTLPVPTAEFERGEIHICGVVITGIDQTHSRVNFIADIDLAKQHTAIAATDRVIRKHLKKATLQIMEMSLDRQTRQPLQRQAHQLVPVDCSSEASTSPPDSFESSRTTSAVGLASA